MHNNRNSLHSFLLLWTLFPFIPNYTDFLILMMVLGIPHGSIFPISTVQIARGSTIEERNGKSARATIVIPGAIINGIRRFLIGLRLMYILVNSETVKKNTKGR